MNIAEKAPIYVSEIFTMAKDKIIDCTENNFPSKISSNRVLNWEIQEGFEEKTELSSYRAQSAFARTYKLSHQMKTQHNK